MNFYRSNTQPLQRNDECKDAGGSSGSLVRFANHIGPQTREGEVYYLTEVHSKSSSQEVLIDRSKDESPSKSIDDHHCVTFNFLIFSI